MDISYITIKLNKHILNLRNNGLITTNELISLQQMLQPNINNTSINNTIIDIIRDYGYTSIKSYINDIINTHNDAKYKSDPSMKFIIPTSISTNNLELNNSIINSKYKLVVNHNNNIIYCKCSLPYNLNRTMMKNTIERCNLSISNNYNYDEEYFISAMNRFIVGQSIAIKKLNSYLSANINSSYLCFGINGTIGIGKKYFIKTMANSINYNFMDIRKINDMKIISNNSRTIFYVKSSFISEKIDEIKNRIKQGSIFVCTYENMNIVKDNFYQINLIGYNNKSKIEIIRRNFNLQETITDDNILTIINNYTYELGTRKLREIISYLSTNQILTIDNVSEKYKKILTCNAISNTYNNLCIGIISCIYYYNNYGGIMKISTTKKNNKNNKIVITGNIKQIMRESIYCAISSINYIFSSNNNINISVLRNIHVHIGDMNTSKDGPSAGGAFALSIVSYLLNKPINSKIIISAEIDTRGNLFCVDEIITKIIIAENNGYNMIFISMNNDISDLDTQLHTIKIVKVSNISEIIEHPSVFVDY